MTNDDETWDAYAQYQKLKQIVELLVDIRDHLNEGTRYLRGIYDNTPAD